MKKNFVPIVLLLLITGCNEPPDPTIHTSCLGYDGIPLPSQAVSLCCDMTNPNLPVLKLDADQDVCRSGLANYALKTSGSIGDNIAVAGALISQTATSLGLTTENKDSPQILGNQGNVNQVGSFAATAPGNFESSGSGDSNPIIDYAKKLFGRGGSGSGGGGGSGSSGGSGSGSKGNTIAMDSTDQPNTKTAEGISYSAGKGGAKGKTDALASASDTAGVNALGFGGGVNTDQLGSTDESAEMGDEGTTADPADYLRRIPLNMSLFRVVSMKYQKKTPKLIATTK